MPGISYYVSLIMCTHYDFVEAYSSAAVATTNDAY